MQKLFSIALILTIVAVLEATHPAHTNTPEIASPPTRNETVVLLHGLARTERAMRKMAKALRADGYRVINHNYPSTSAPIADLTTAVFDAINPKIDKAETVHFVTHSMGGILLRQYLETHDIPNLGRTVMLAPPSRGSEVPDKLGGFTLFQKLNGPAGNQLGTSNTSIPLQLSAPDFELGIIAGDRSVNPILSLLIPGPDDGKVALSRVKPATMTDYAQIHATHTFISQNAKAIAQTKYFLAHGKFQNQAVSHGTFE